MTSTKPTSDISKSRNLILWLLSMVIAMVLISAGIRDIKPKIVKNQYLENFIGFDKTGRIFDEPHIDYPVPVYKNGTIEYIGDDYLVKPDAGVDELLNKMVGFDLDPSGTITFQGRYITKAKLNEKNIDGDNLYNAIKRIPASNIEKVVVVPEKNGQTVRTGNQPIQPEYVLNLITYTNKKAFMAAKRTISGKVTDKLGAVLVGVNVSVAEMMGKRVKTDANGNFKIDLPTRKNVLVVDYTGHYHKHIKVGKQNKLYIKIEPFKYVLKDTSHN